MSWRAARLVPSQTYSAVEPVMLAPPWIHTNTARGVARSAGAQTLRVRQSSLSRTSGGRASVIGPVGWTDAIPNAEESRTSRHGWVGWGGANRSDPTGGAA